MTIKSSMILRANRLSFCQSLTRLALRATALAFMAVGQPVYGQETDADRLEDLTSELEDARSLEAEQSAEKDQIAGEIDTLDNDLIDTARRLHDQEIALDESQAQLAALILQERRRTKDLEEERAKLAKFVGAVQTLERQRPPALLVHPNDAASAVRSAILLNDIIPRLKTQANQVAEDLSQLKKVRQVIVEERTRIALVEDALRQDRNRIKDLLDQKRQREADLERDLDEQRAYIGKLAAEARSLKGLIQGLEQAAALGRLPQVKPQLNEEGENRQTAPEVIRFSQAKGNIQLPVKGEVVQHYGATDLTGQAGKGLKIAVSGQAQVVSPFDGQIVFAGPFMQHEHLLLIEAGEGYHILISGMAHIYGEVGDRLLTGEPVGMMGMEQDAQEGTPVRTTSLLYLEFRKDGEPVDPTPWLAPDDRKVSG